MHAHHWHRERRANGAGTGHVRRPARQDSLQRQAIAGCPLRRGRDGAAAHERRGESAESVRGAWSFRVCRWIRAGFERGTGRWTARPWRSAPCAVGRGVVGKEERNADRRVCRDTPDCSRELPQKNHARRWRKRRLHRQRARKPSRFRSSDQLGRARDNRRTVSGTGQDRDRHVGEAGNDTLGTNRKPSIRQIITSWPTSRSSHGRWRPPSAAHRQMFELRRRSRR